MSPSDLPTRRKAIRYIIGGAALLPDLPALCSARPEVQLKSEQNQVCHQVRDGTRFTLPAPSSECDVVIVGGGPSGLMAAYKLRHENFLLLEKELRLGGDAISEEWRGVWYSTGSAYAGGRKLEELCRELGMTIYRIQSADAAIINNRLVPDFWSGGLWKSDYSDAAKKNFGRFMADMKVIALEKNAARLDAMTFAELLRPYGPEVKLWFDNYGPNNWGADTENTSALIGAQAGAEGAGLDPDRFTWAGGLGRISMALETAIEKAGSGRVRKNATVVRVENIGSGVRVVYIENGEARTVAARGAIVACPKLIAKHIVQGIPPAQLHAMESLRYCPYLVVNVCSREVIYNGSYDTDIPAPCPIVDFNVADWVLNRGNRETKRPGVLTCYMPRPESDRVRLLDDAYVLGFGRQALDLLDTWFPGARQKVEEVRIYRRGHPLFMSAPGVTTRLAPTVRRPVGNIFFAHSDSEGWVSSYESALSATERAVAEAARALGGHVPQSS